MSYTAPNVPPSGLTFSQSRGGLSAILEAIIAKLLVPTANPTTAPTVAVTGGGASGGSLAAGAYWLSYAETNGIGWTLPKETAASFTVAAGNIPRATFPALGTGNTARAVFLTPVGGASGSEVLYATGITTTTFDLSAAAPADTRMFAKPPTANTTAVGTKHVQALRSIERGNLVAVWRDAAKLFGEFHRGEPMDFLDAKYALGRAAATFAALSQAIADAGAVIDGNPGTFAVDTTGIGGATRKRHFS